eukprot:CAMPEP_0113300686 /NCGR_PEP_ID=MMETSP0010_2-20120614/2210_1 /TAXON_ID=216773 ORGANISM="Corethron hystrix, Strain 308" /NCGR_SAMPLE_ID=MMETSP0010_2 /ASSEMBLY_ACC=CAM_ASM_000155 /LENGTH=47 /DNA_ID=CAMNT_0000154147 /DNA_START=1042 /DNA_END=1185 /DNA_ORIENTATION=- /assembly_acc=CAM_ASM_000155
MTSKRQQKLSCLMELITPGYITGRNQGSRSPKSPKSPKLMHTTPNQL